jgi:hypothetical protein
MITNVGIKAAATATYKRYGLVVVFFAMVLEPMVHNTIFRSNNKIVWDS